MPTFSFPAEEEPYWKAATIDPIMSKMMVLPRLAGKPDDEPKVLLQNFEKWLQILVRNLVTLKQAASLANGHLVKLVKEAAATGRVDPTEKLITIGMEVQKLKEEFDERRRRIELLIRRFEEFDARAKENQPLTEQERKLAKQLQEYRRKALGMCDKTAQLAIAVANEKRDTFGPSQSFTPSMTSYSATIEKTVQEVDFLRGRAVKLQELVDAE